MKLSFLRADAPSPVIAMLIHGIRCSARNSTQECDRASIPSKYRVTGPPPDIYPTPGGCARGFFPS